MRTIFNATILAAALLAAINASARVLTEEEFEQIPSETIVQTHPLLECTKKVIKQNPPPVTYEEIVNITIKNSCVNESVKLYKFCVEEIRVSDRNCLHFIADVVDMADIEVLSGITMAEFRKNPDWRIKIKQLQAQDEQLRQRALALSNKRQPEQQPLTTEQDEIQKKAAGSLKVIKQEPKDPDWKAKIGLLFEKDLQVPNAPQDKQELLIADQAKNEEAPYHPAPAAEVGDSHEHNDVQKTPDNSKIQQENAELSRYKAKDALDEANKQINIVWNATTKAIRAAILPEQREWIKQRENECSLKASTKEPNNTILQDAIRLNCMAVMTDKRTEALKKKIASMTQN